MMSSWLGRGVDDMSSASAGYSSWSRPRTVFQLSQVMCRIIRVMASPVVVRVGGRERGAGLVRHAPSSVVWRPRLRPVSPSWTCSTCRSPRRAGARRGRRRGRRRRAVPRVGRPRSRGWRSNRSWCEVAEERRSRCEQGKSAGGGSCLPCERGLLSLRGLWAGPVDAGRLDPTARSAVVCRRFGH